MEHYDLAKRADRFIALDRAVKKLEYRRGLAANGLAQMMKVSGKPRIHRKGHVITSELHKELPVSIESIDDIRWKD